MKMCEYKFRNGERCKEEAQPNSEYCILHVDLPEDEKSEGFKRINELKEEKVKEKVNKGDFNFEGAKLLKIDFSKMEIEGDVKFCDVVIIRDALFGKAKIGGTAFFAKAKIGGSVFFYEAKIGGTAFFYEAKIGGYAWFNFAEIGDSAVFDKAKIGGTVLFDLLEIKGKLSFRDAIFKKNKAQEESCRKAKRVWEEFGDRIEVDYYFYREMEAKRKLKYLKFSLKPILKLIRKLRLEKVISNHIVFFEKILKQRHKLGLEKLIDKHKEIFGKERRIYWGFLELPVQYIFGYGVHPLWVIGWWFITVLSLAFVYWYGNGIIIEENLLWWKRIILSIYFSIITAATPGYGGYKPVPGFYQALASFEAIFGTFMWAAFIATFARKYMR